MPKGTISYAVDDKIILSARLHCLIILLDKTYIITEKGTCKAFSFGFLDDTDVASISNLREYIVFLRESGLFIKTFLTFSVKIVRVRR